MKWFSLAVEGTNLRTSKGFLIN